MSYIRCTSNPESLYVYGSAECVNWSWHDEKDRLRTATCTYAELNAMAKKFGGYAGGSVKCGTVTIDTVPSRYTRRIMDISASGWKWTGGKELIHRVSQSPEVKARNAVTLKRLKYLDRNSGKVRIRFVNGRVLIMWLVTWRSVVRSVESHMEFDRKRKLEKRKSK